MQQLKCLMTFALMLASFFMYAQSCNETTLLTYEIKARWTDPAIAFELNNHIAWYNPDCDSRNVLLVHLVGTFDNPKNTTYFPALAANNGYHVVSLKYPNGITARTPCLNSSDPDCYENFRREVLEGDDYHAAIEVDSVNCITNRLVKLLEYLAENNQGEGWEQYLAGEELQWNQLAFSGHSQGGGYGPLIAKDHLVDRVIMFASPNDYSEHFSAPASWTMLPSVTPDSSFYGFANRFDDVVDFSEQYLQWNALGLASFGDTVLVTTEDCFQAMTHQLYTTLQTAGLSGNHNLMVRDDDTPLDESGQPLFTSAWRYLLGIDCIITNNSTIPEQKIQNRLFPNPFSGTAAFQLLGIDQQHYTLTISTITGQTVMQIEGFGDELLTIEGTQLREGAYFYRVHQDDSMLLTSGKLVVVSNH